MSNGLEAEVAKLAGVVEKMSSGQEMTLHVELPFRNEAGIEQLKEALEGFLRKDNIPFKSVELAGHCLRITT